MEEDKQYPARRSGIAGPPTSAKEATNQPDSTLIPTISTAQPSTEPRDRSRSRNHRSRSPKYAVGYHLSTVGQERGTVTGRPRRCGWLDAAALKRSVLINGISGVCITKLDVLDGLKEIKVCAGYMLNGQRIDILPLDADEIVNCEPIYETFPGWEGTTFGVDLVGRVAGQCPRLSVEGAGVHRYADRHGVDRP